MLEYSSARFIKGWLGFACSTSEALRLYNVYIKEERARAVPYFKSSRKVYISDNYVVKFELEFFGSQNEKEENTWKNIPKHLRKYFAPVVGSGSFILQGYPITYLIQRKVLGEKRPYLDLEDIQDILREKISVRDVKLSDLHSENVLFKANGQPVIVDYGFCHSHRRAA